MANINKELNEIKNAVHGKEVRGSIHDGIKKINNETQIATVKSEQAHDVMESIINEGFNDAALKSEFERKLDDEINNLQPEWTGFKTDTVLGINDNTTELTYDNDDNVVKVVERKGSTIVRQTDLVYENGFVKNVTEQIDGDIVRTTYIYENDEVVSISREVLS